MDSNQGCKEARRSHTVFRSPASDQSSPVNIPNNVLTPECNALSHYLVENTFATSLPSSFFSSGQIQFLQHIQVNRPNDVILE